MKLIVFFAFCLVAINADDLMLNNIGYYWKDWNVKEPIPIDAVPGGVDKNGNKTFIAKTLFPQIKIIMSGKACPAEQNMWFTYNYLAYQSTKYVFILCSINHHRFYWVPIKTNDYLRDVEKDQKVLVVGSTDQDKRLVGIGRKAIGNQVHIGNFVVSDVIRQFYDLQFAEDKKCSRASDYEVLVYDNTPNKCNSTIVKFGVKN